MEIFNKKWLFHMVPNDKGQRYIQACYSPSQLKNSLTICFTPNVIPDDRYPDFRGPPFRSQDNKPVRLYSVFLSYYQFYDYLKNFVVYDHCFYEIVHGDFPQKIHFDIDIPDKFYLDLAEDVKDKLIDSVIEVMLNLNNIRLRIEHDFLIFSSHSDRKRSFHIVIDNYYVKSNRECKQFYLLCIEQMPREYANFVDHSVYGSLQNFRILNSTKCDEYRPKKYQEIFLYKGSEVKNVILDEGFRDHVLLSHSLCSFTHDCEHVPGLTQKVTYRKISQVGELSTEAVDQALDLMKNIIEEHDAFEEGKVEDSIINLKRTRDYLCPICTRLDGKEHWHESENPFIFVIGKSAYWTCRRAGRKNIYLGEIREDDLILDPTEDEQMPLVSTGLFDIPKLEEQPNMFSRKKFTPAKQQPPKGPVINNTFNTVTYRNDCRRTMEY